MVAEGEGLPASVRLVEHPGSAQIVHVDATLFEVYNPEHTSDDDLDDSPRLLVNVRDDVRLRAGDDIHLRVGAGHLHAFDAANGDAIGR